MDKYTIALTSVHCVQGLHQADIVHGDLKPSNILIMKTPMSYAARLIDFDDSYATGDPPEMLIGTPDYYAPEVFRYLKDDTPQSGLTTRADVFSLGIILCEYFTGRRPRIAGNRTKPDTVAEAVIKGSTLDTGLSDGMDNLDG
jgi:serine/threonine protein kinase